ncbi:hypothetical protein HAX54_019165 [Datura stramonium]|uniref:Uncharacterized protein n=1 Tax=Datura stramonium TaxID=4076 RepID=A0ABS8UQX3_DATST|nr:hypothetical protein [Datura stramonium]
MATNEGTNSGINSASTDESWGQGVDQHSAPFVDVFKDTFIPTASHLPRQVSNRFADVQNVPQPTTVTNGPEGITEMTLQRKSTRARVAPILLKYFVTTQKTSTTPYSIDNYIKYDHLSSSYQDFTAVSSVEVEPSS